MANPTPKCYGCIHRGAVPGSAHSTCGHKVVQDPVVQMAGILGVLVNQTKWPILPSLDPHGHRMGWANWPMDFDPIWIDSCGLFEAAPTDGQS